MKKVTKEKAEKSSIHEFDFNLICEYFSSIKQQGPGSKETTLKAISFIEGLNKKSKIADLGCGTGSPTMVIAKNTQANIVGVDIFPGFINIFNKNFIKIKNRVKGIVGSMDKLPFKQEEFDVIWSEGSIYNIGFERGLNEWKKFIKKGGYVAISEASWFTNTRPEEINNFWNKAYPEIDTISNKIRQIENAGYMPVATFILPEGCWIENFYKPQAVAQKEFLKKYKGNVTVEKLISNQRLEAELYKKYKQYYGYVFYIAKKI